MRIKLTLLATLFTLLTGFQTAQAQRKATNIPERATNTPVLERLVVTGVHGTITVAVPLGQKLSELKCSDIEVKIGQDETPQSGLQIPIFKVVASKKATGDISSGKCSYSMPNSSGLQVKTYKMSLETSKNVPVCEYIGMNFDSPKSVTFPTGNKGVTIDFALKPSCVQIN